jgi:hypothetical protein
MTYARLTALLGLAAAASAFRAEAYEVNAWPAFVLQKAPSGQTESWTGAGPLLFSGPAPAPDTGTASGFRPFYVKGPGDGSVKTDILYPLFFFRKYPDAYKWSVFQLINGEGIDASVTRAGGATDRHFDIWPFYFSHETGDPVDSYHALLPIYGTVKYRVGFDRLSWVLFPLYAESTSKGTNSTYTPWPFIKVLRGRENGFAVWPLIGVKSGPGPIRHFYCLWPLIWNNVTEPKPDAPETDAPGTEFGILPLYTREKSPGVISENYLWPFFGYTERTIPYRYSEKRYFWPFLLQGRGDDRVLNRWGPFYTYSNTKGTASTWVVWPFWHRGTFADGDIAQSKTQFFYFLYWSLDETSVSRPWLAPAYKRHIWPLVSIWDNGAGSRQVQIPSPIEVFFADNPDIRKTWTPLFSIYRYDHKPTGESRNSLLWNAVTWRRSAAQGLEEFHIGPLLGMRRGRSGATWTILGFDLGSNRDKDMLAIR